jgi:hypothetical protein
VDEETLAQDLARPLQAELADVLPPHGQIVESAFHAGGEPVQALLGELGGQFSSHGAFQVSPAVSDDKLPHVHPERKVQKQDFTIITDVYGVHPIISRQVFQFNFPACLRAAGHTEYSTSNIEHRTPNIQHSTLNSEH